MKKYYSTPDILLCGDNLQCRQTPHGNVFVGNNPKTGMQRNVTVISAVVIFCVQHKDQKKNRLPSFVLFFLEDKVKNKSWMQEVQSTTTTFQKPFLSSTE